METAAAAENAQENKKTETDMDVNLCLFFVCLGGERILSGKNCINQEKAIDNFS